MALANSRVQYFLPEQEAHLKEFDAAVRRGGTVFTNAKGETMTVARYWLPLGFINDQTVFRPRTDGSKDYHTPLANLEDSKDGRVALIVPGERRQISMTSHEFLAWLGAEFTVEATPETPVDPQIAAQVANIAALSEMHKADYEEHKKKGWVSASDRKKSKKG